jgi:hypothetical protein
LWRYYLFDVVLIEMLQNCFAAADNPDLDATISLKWAFGVFLAKLPSIILNKERVLNV